MMKRILATIFTVAMATAFGTRGARGCPGGWIFQGQGETGGHVPGAGIRSAGRARAGRAVRTCAGTGRQVPSVARSGPVAAYLSAQREDSLQHRPLTGWEEPNGELRGHFIGHYLFGMRNDVCQHRGRALQGQRPEGGQGAGGGAGEVGGQRVSGRVAGDVHRPRRGAAARVGAVLHAAQNLCGPGGRVRLLRRSAGAGRGQEDGRLGDCAEQQADRSADAENARRGARRNERIAGEPLCVYGGGEVPGDLAPLQSCRGSSIRWRRE